MHETLAAQGQALVQKYADRQDHMAERVEERLGFKYDLRFGGINLSTRLADTIADTAIEFRTQFHVPFPKTVERQPTQRRPGES